jgi:hypothetical protein
MTRSRGSFRPFQGRVLVRLNAGAILPLPLAVVCGVRGTPMEPINVAPVKSCVRRRLGVP